MGGSAQSGVLVCLACCYLRRSSAALEVQAAALVGSAQLSMASKKWEAAEEVLGQAVKAAEGKRLLIRGRVVVEGGKG